ncbi:MAG: HAD family hydrolase [Myxococcota bacterium]
MRVEPSTSRRGAFFDLERTLTRHAVEQAVGTASWRRGDLPTSGALRMAWAYLKYDLGLVGEFEALKRAGAVVFTGRDHARDVAQFLAWFAEEGRAAIFPEARAAVDAFRAGGVPVWIVSSTYDFMVAPYARELGCAGFFGCSLEVVDGRCTGRIAGTIWHQETKARAVREVAAAEGIDLAQSWAFGDSVNDEAMLRAVGRPKVVNPGRALRRRAEERGWEVLRWGGG